jgi:hypothetical protein
VCKFNRYPFDLKAEAKQSPDRRTIDGVLLVALNFLHPAAVAEFSSQHVETFLLAEVVVADAQIEIDRGPVVTEFTVLRDG